MNRLDEFLTSFRSALVHSTAVEIYAQTKKLEYEISEYQWPDYFAHWALGHRAQNLPHTLALQSAINVFKLSYELGLATPFRRLLMTAVLIRTLPTHLSNTNRLKSEVLHACLHKKERRHHYAYYLVDWSLHLARYQLALDGKGTLNQLLIGEHHLEYWPYAELSRPYRVEKLTNEHLEPALQHKRATPAYLNNSVKPPKTLLKAIKRFADGTDSLIPIIAAIEQQPGLRKALHQAAREHAQVAPFKSTKHAYLYLGAQRASRVLASASLQQHLDRHRIPLHESLMQRLSLLIELWRQLNQTAQIKWPVREKLIAQIIATDLIHHPTLASAIRWPTVPDDTPLSIFSIIGAVVEIERQKYSSILIHRWRLPEQVNHLIRVQHEVTNKQQTVFLLGCILLQQLYAGEKQTPKRWLALLPKLCERLNLDATQLLRIKHDAISFCHSYTPLNTHICAVNDYNHPSE